MGPAMIPIRNPGDTLRHFDFQRGKSDLTFPDLAFLNTSTPDPRLPPRFAAGLMKLWFIAAQRAHTLR